MGWFGSAAEKENSAGQAEHVAEIPKPEPEITFKPFSDSAGTASSPANTQEIEPEPIPTEQRNQPDNMHDAQAAQTSFQPVTKQSDETDAALHADKTFTVYFPGGDYALDSDSVETLDEVKRLLIQHPGLRAEVTGYSDSLGDDQYNLHLSRIRANIVKSYLIGNGVDSGKIDSEGLGSRNPVASNETGQGRAKNRRVEIVFDYSPP